MSKTLAIHPRISEKAYASSQKGIYIFVVPKGANKVEIARAVESQYDVSVVSVNVTVQKGKPVRFYRKGKFDSGSRSDIRKAYVRLAKDQSIPVFATDETEQKSTDKQAKKGTKE